MPSAQQSAASHTALDPITHFVLMPIFTITFGIAIYLAAHTETDRAVHLWLIVLAFAFILLNMKTRIYALKLQDRIIRLEERLRLSAILPQVEAADASARLSTRQLIALRFASDAELPDLVTRSLADHLSAKQIKEAIEHWRADLARV